MRTVISRMVLLTLLAPGSLAAQDRFSIELRAGRAIPAGNLADVSASGLTFGGGAAVRVHGPWHARLDLESSFLGEGEPEPGVKSPGINFVHRTLGLERAIGRAWSGGPLVSANLGAGVSTFDVEAYVARVGPDAGRTFASSRTHPSLTGGLTAEVAVGRHLALLLRTQAYAVLTDEEHTSQFQRISTEAEPFRRAWSVPISAGVRLRW